ncbi:MULTISPECIES: hypothetical protein, partial [unclassified Serratia (in: enterobacteria)]|uniref:hypothetical protein n=2 Tax=Serratia TaxID=613 RepID=UPI003075F6FE
EGEAHRSMQIYVTPAAIEKEEFTDRLRFERLPLPQGEGEAHRSMQICVTPAAIEKEEFIGRLRLERFPLPQGR